MLKLIYYVIKTVATDTPGGKRKCMKIVKAQQMTFRQDITKYKIYWLTFRCIVHSIFRAIKLSIYKRVSNSHAMPLKSNLYSTLSKLKTCSTLRMLFLAILDQRCFTSSLVLYQFTSPVIPVIYS
jgi:hypothetical protein